MKQRPSSMPCPEMPWLPSGFRAKRSNFIKRLWGLLENATHNKKGNREETFFINDFPVFFL
jgi:hypothetical protein